MKKYGDDIKKELIQVICNKCGKDIIVDREIVKEGHFSIVYGWGYFSEKDGQVHKFELCEKCYDEYTSSFVIPLDVEERNELI